LHQEADAEVFVPTAMCCSVTGARPWSWHYRAQGDRPGEDKKWA
jgi:hypothetical protein